MTHEAELRSAAAGFLGTEVSAAGVFGLQDDYAYITAGGVTAAVALDATGIDSPLASGVAAAAGTHVAREVHAEKEGLAVVMLVAVTDDAIHVLDWPGDSTPTREFLRFDRATAHITIKKMGLSRHLDIEDPTTGTKVGLTGSTAFFSSVSEGDKLVLGLLSAA